MRQGVGMKGERNVWDDTKREKSESEKISRQKRYERKGRMKRVKERKKYGGRRGVT